MTTQQITQIGGNESGSGETCLLCQWLRLDEYEEGGWCDHDPKSIFIRTPGQRKCARFTAKEEQS